MKNMFLILSILLTIYSCNKNDDNQVFPQNKEFNVIYSGVLSGNGSEGIIQSNMVINNTTDWQNLIIQMNSFNNVSGNFSETDIDFDNYLIIAVFLEVKPNGWEVQINNITENENSLVVSTNENEFDSSVITQPFSIVKIRRTEKTIEFE
tara:strand:+ start:296 stop:745 length:450 start_codon:yes stop_codon:yes gene_type:complete